MNQTQILATLVIALVTTVAQGQRTWTEIGDAPEGPEGATGHQETVGVGPLDAITGFYDGIKDHVDTFAIEVTDMDLFSVTTSTLLGETISKHRLWLWADATLAEGGSNLLMSNETAPVAFSCGPEDCSLLTQPFNWPDGEPGLVDDPLPVVDNGRYLLSISYNENDPIDGVGMGTPLANLDGNPDALVGRDTTAGAFVSWENAGGLSDNYTLLLTGVTYSMVPEPPVDGDFNDDTFFDCLDIDALTAEVAAGTNNPDFDMNSDGSVNIADRNQWLVDGAAANGVAGPYLIGDHNLSGDVDVSDFIEWNANKFTSVAAWCLGDNNADGTVDVSDFIGWNANKFTSSGAPAVPEPTGWVLPGLAALILTAFRRR